MSHCCYFSALACGSRHTRRASRRAWCRRGWWTKRPSPPPSRPTPRASRKRRGVRPRRNAHVRRRSKSAGKRSAGNRKRPSARSRPRKRKKAEKKKAAALEKKRAEEKRRKEAESALQSEVAAEEQRRQDERALSEFKRYEGLIKQKVQRSWNRPTGFKEGTVCLVRVRLVPGGEVIQATIVQSCGNPVFDRSVENAVFKASPLPVPEGTALLNATSVSSILNLYPLAR